MILKHLLLDAGGLLSVDCDEALGKLHVLVDRSKISSHGTAAIGHILHKIHIWRCTADVTSCRALYEPLSTVDGQYEVWQKVVISKPEAPWKFVQPIPSSEKMGKLSLRCTRRETKVSFNHLRIEGFDCIKLGMVEVSRL